MILALFLLAIENLLSNRFYNRPGKQARLPGPNKPPDGRILRMTGVASISLTMDPAWPWSVPGTGLAALLIAATVLTGITVWTYHGVQNTSRSRMLILVGLRIGALVLAFLAILRPSLAIQSPFKNPSTLLITIDRSQSMTIRDQHDGLSRWDYLKKLMTECQPDLDRLRNEFQVSVPVASFADDVGEFHRQKSRRPAHRFRFHVGDTLRTQCRRAFPAWLAWCSATAPTTAVAIPLSASPPGSASFRARSPPLPSARQLSSSNQSDLAFTQINPEPVPVAIKGKLTVKGLIDAPGFQQATVPYTWN